MFERYNEQARRVIFFARYEASAFGSPYIESEHILLALIREDRRLVTGFLPLHAVNGGIREQIEKQSIIREKLSTSVDIPLSAAVRRMLIFAEEEAEGELVLTPAHLFLGLLRIKDCLATRVLEKYGLSVETVRQELHGSIEAGTVKAARGKPTACRDCKHLVIDGEIREENLYCGASPIKPRFDCYTGEFVSEDSIEPSKRLKRCARINFGECEWFEPK